MAPLLEERERGGGVNFRDDEYTSLSIGVITGELIEEK